MIMRVRRWRIRKLLIALVIQCCSAATTTSSANDTTTDGNFSTTTDQSCDGCCAASNSSANFQQVNGIFYACPVYGACLADGLCSDFHTGPLCAMCTSGIATRHRDGEACGACQRGYQWLRLVFFYFFSIVIMSVGVTLQYWATAAPLSSPAAIAEKKYKEKVNKEKRKQYLIKEAERAGKDPPKELLKPEPDYDPHEVKAGVSPILLCGIFRQVMDHHHFTSIAWGYSGLGLVFPSSVTWMAQYLNIDYFHLMDMNCDITNFFYDDVVMYSMFALPMHMIFWCMTVRFFGYQDACGFCMPPERAMFFDVKALDETFAKMDDDGDGKLTKEEILEAIKPKNQQSQLPSTNVLTLGALTVLFFFQMPVFNKNWLYNMDCVSVGGQTVLRWDLDVACGGSESYLAWSIIGFIVFSVGSIGVTFLCIWYARRVTRASEDEEGNISTDDESAYAFLLAGLKDQTWWYSLWKMLVKEILPLAVILNRTGGDPIDPGVSDTPAVLVLIGAVSIVISGVVKPFDQLHEKQLMSLERMSWLSFLAGPLTRMMIANRTDVYLDAAGNKIVGQWTQEASTVFHWIAIIFSLALYFSTILYAVYLVLKEKRGWGKLQKMTFDVGERLFVTIPGNTKQRKMMCESLAKLFHEALLQTTRASDEEETLIMSPAACIESAMLIAMTEDAAYYGDLKAGTHHILDVDPESVSAVVGLLARDREKQEMKLSRKILDSGGFAEQCLIRSKVAVPEPDLPTPSSPYQNNLAGTNDIKAAIRQDDLAGATLIMLNFSIERVDLRSLGFKEGGGDKKTRPGVQRALERAIAHAGSAQESHIDLQVHTVGVDRVLCTVSITNTSESELNIREEWLRTALGTQEARKRWIRGLEADLVRVGVIAANDTKFTVRFSKGSKPQRTTPDGAHKLLQAVVRAAQVDQNQYRAPSEDSYTPNSSVVGRLNNSDVDSFDSVPNARSPGKGFSKGQRLGVEAPDGEARRRSNRSTASGPRRKPKSRPSPGIDRSLYDA